MYSHTESRAVPIKLLKRDHGDVSPHPYGNSNNMKIHLKQFQNTCYTKHQEIFANMWILIVYIWCQLCWILCLGCSQVLSGFTICANCNVKLFPKRFQISHYFLQSIRKVTRFDNLSYVYDAEKWTDKNQKQKGHRKHLKNYLKLWFKQSEYYIFLQSACIHSQCGQPNPMVGPEASYLWQISLLDCYFPAIAHLAIHLPYSFTHLPLQVRYLLIQHTYLLMFTKHSSMAKWFLTFRIDKYCNWSIFFNVFQLNTFWGLLMLWNGEF